MVLEDLDPRAKETLEILEKEVKTSERIISGLLDFARAGPPIQRRVDLNGVLQGVLSRMTVPQGIEVVSQLDESLPTILADPDQIAQVFGNVILNGFQSMPEGGRLVIKAEVPSPKWSVVSFSDTGVGIPEENLARVFEPLFTTKAKGIGLGLSVVREIVERHGGWVTVESEEGVGSTFAIWLPLSD
jgi:signal transduction histidine kinase